MPKGHATPYIPVTGGDASCPHLSWTLDNWNTGTCDQCGARREYPSELRTLRAERYNHLTGRYNRLSQANLRGIAAMARLQAQKATKARNGQ